MGESLCICIKAVMPIFLLIFIGTAMRRKKLLNSGELKSVNRFVFHTFFPFMMFKSIYSSDIKDAVSVKFVGFGLVAVFIIFLISIPIVKIFEKDRKKQAVMIQDCFRSNFIIMGLPIIENIFGPDSLGVPTVMMAFAVPFFNVLAVITFEAYRGNKTDFKKVTKGVITNPIIKGAVVGLIFSIFEIPLPYVIEESVFAIGDACAVIALIILGASFDVSRVKKLGNAKALIFIMVSRLVVVPLIMLSCSLAVGFKGVEFVTLIIMSAAPPSVSSYTMAEAMDSDGELAGDAVVFGSAVSCFTLFMWLFVFKTAGVF